MSREIDEKRLSLAVFEPELVSKGVSVLLQFVFYTVFSKQMCKAASL